MNEKKFKIRCRAVIIYEGKLLVVKHDKDFLHYGLPGGKLDHGEGPIECFERELMEEFGVKVKNPKLIYVHTFIGKGGSHNVEFFFTIENNQEFLDNTNNVGTHKDEIFEIRWMSREDDLNLLPEQFKNDFKNGNLDFSQVKFIKTININ